MGMDIAQAVVTRVATTEFEFGFAGREIEFIVGYQHLFWGNFVKPRQRGHRFARQVHESGRRQKPQGLTLKRGAGSPAVVIFLRLQLHLELLGELIDEPKPSVVAGVLVFSARVAQANKQFDLFIVPDRAHGIYEGKNMLVIKPDECIDCGVCEPECPVDAITADTEPGSERWLKINKTYSEIWPNISEKKDPPADHEKFKNEQNKYEKYFKENL